MCPRQDRRVGVVINDPPYPKRWDDWWVNPPIRGEEEEVRPPWVEIMQMVVVVIMD